MDTSNATELLVVVVVVESVIVFFLDSALPTGMSSVAASQT